MKNSISVRLSNPENPVSNFTCQRVCSITMNKSTLSDMITNFYVKIFQSVEWQCILFVKVKTHKTSIILDIYLLIGNNF